MLNSLPVKPDTFIFVKDVTHHSFNRLVITRKIRQKMVKLRLIILWLQDQLLDKFVNFVQQAS